MSAMPHYVACRCQYCDGHIEFDATSAGETVACPHCGLETKLFVPDTTPPIIAVPKRKSGGRKWILLALVVAIVAIVIWYLRTIQGFGEFVGGCLVFLLILAGGLVSFVIYFLPTIISLLSKKTNTAAIVVLNIFLGWTLIGWVVALVWSTMKDDKI